MSEKYKVRSNHQLYFITNTVTAWMDVFTRTYYREILLDSIRYNQKEKGLIVHAWVVMTNHFHIIASTDNIPLNEIVQHFKSHTSKQLTEAIEETNESRSKWLLDKFTWAAKQTARGKKYKFWQDGFHPIELERSEVHLIDQKLNYIHNNPVKAGFVAEPEHFLYSSAIDYAGGKGLLDVVHLY